MSRLFIGALATEYCVLSTVRDALTEGFQVMLLHDAIRPTDVEPGDGDLAEHARRVRGILDAGGLREVRIFSSGNLDEYARRALLDAGAPIDGFGVGTNMTLSADAPALDCAYKLTEYAGLGRRKHSEGKANWPGRKQVYRRTDDAGGFVGDLLTLHDAPADGTPLLQCVMRAGRRSSAPESLGAIRERVRREVDALPQPLQALSPAPAYPVAVGPELRALASEVDARLRRADAEDPG